MSSQSRYDKAVEAERAAREEADKLTEERRAADPRPTTVFFASYTPTTDEAWFQWKAEEARLEKEAIEEEARKARQNAVDGASNPDLSSTDREALEQAARDAGNIGETKECCVM